MSIDNPTQTSSISHFTSQKFRFWTFASMFCLVFVHGYNLNHRYLQPWTLPEEALTITGFTEYLFANGILRFRIPMLFMISGYLYALHDTAPYKDRVKKRLKTLLGPYLFWSAAGLAITWLLELFPYTRDLVISSHVVQIDNSRMLEHDYHWYEIVARWIFFPVAYQLWFIRVLLVYNIAYPAIRWCVSHPTIKWIFFGVLFLLWLSTAGFVLIEGEGLLFFSLAVWMQKTGFNIEVPIRWLRPFGWAVCFVVVAAIKTWLAFEGVALLGQGVFPALIIMHKLVVVSGLIACWYGLNSIASWWMQKKWFVKLTSYSFVIYALHAPFVAFAINGALEIFNMQGGRMIVFVILPLTIIAGCIAIGFLFKMTAPRLYNLLTGGRA